MAAFEVSLLSWSPSASSPPLKKWATGRPYLVFADSVSNTAYMVMKLPADYASNAALEVRWSASVATGNVVLECSVMAVTPETDTDDILVDSYAVTPNSVTDSHLGTTAGRLHEASIDLTTNFDSAAAGDYIGLKLARNGSSGSDTLAGEVHVHQTVFNYTSS